MKTEKDSPLYNKRYRYIPAEKRLIETYEIMRDHKLPVMLDLFAENAVPVLIKKVEQL